MTYSFGEEDPVIVQLQKWESSRFLANLAQFREAFLSPIRELILLLSYHHEGLLLPLVKGGAVSSIVSYPMLSDINSLAWGICEDSNSADNQEEIVVESIKHAKEAIALDVKDGNSWYNLGNACLTCFFVTGAWDHSKLHQSLKAYQNVEKDESMKSNPNLYFNSATVNTYLENYERALSGFEAAASKNPCLNATEEVQKMVNLFNKLDTLLKGQIKAKWLAS
ncbi:hypothetical protein Lser_V15G17977 [Lactuca serriola]